MPDSTEPSRSALRAKNFRIFLCGNAISVIGLWVQRLAIGWQAWQLSESPLMVGLVAGAQFMPLLLLTPFFGVLVDRIKRRNGAIVMHVIMIIISSLLAMLTLRGAITIEWLLGLALVNGIAYSAYSPIRLSLIPDLVDRSQFPSAVAINSIVFNASRFIGPGIAGGIVALYGVGFAYVVNAVTYLPVIVALLFIDPVRAASVSSRETGFIDQLLEGIRYSRNHASIRQVILIAGVSTFFGRGIIEIFPALVVLIFDGDSASLAAMMAAAGAGAIGSSVIFSLLRSHRHLPKLVLTGAIGIGASMFLLANVKQIEYGLAVTALLGFFATMVSIGSQSEMQIKVDDELRGRVMSIWTLVIIGGPAIGSIVAGALASELGSTYTLLLLAITSLLLTALVVLRRTPGSANQDHG